MKKLLSIMTLCLILTLIFTIPVGASNVTDEQVIKNQLEDLAVEYDFSIDEDISDISTFLKFDSIEEFEEFMSNFITENIENEIETMPLSLQNELAPLSYGPFTRVHTLNWYSPFSGWGMTGIANWKNIAFTYRYQILPSQTQYRQFTTSNPVYDISSHISGIQVGVSWHQTNAIYNISTSVVTRDTANFTVQGYYRLGVEVIGFPIGVTKNDTWTRSFKLN